MLVQHVLVPIDFSATADRALKCHRLGTTTYARLTLLHVLHLNPLAMGEMSTGMPATYLEAQETEAHQLLQASLDRMQHAGLQATVSSSRGHPRKRLRRRRANRGGI